MLLRERHNIVLIGAGCLALAWAIIRAYVQSVTIDEADFYLGYIAPNWPSHWYPTSGNHVLHSALVRLVTFFFGLSHLTFRAPALLGATIYIFAAYKLSRLLAADGFLRLGLFLCLTYNPFVMDYMAASRGYALALGFLTLGVLIHAGQLVNEKWSAENCCWASVCFALSLCANFSFAIADLIVLSFFSALAAWPSWKQGQFRTVARILAACFLPGVLVVFLICGSVLSQFPRSQLYYGATSVRESWQSITDSLFFEINPYIANPLLAAALLKLRPILPYAFCVVVLLQFLLLYRYRPWRQRSGSVNLVPLQIVLAGSIALSFFLHWLAFRLLQIPLPKERTGLFLVPLALLTLAAGTLACRSVRFGHAIHISALILLWIGAIYFVACMRLDYFKEWKFGADVRSAYGVLDQLHREHGEPQIFSSWEFAQSLNFYRALNGNSKMPAFQDLDSDTYPRGKCVYVIRDNPEDQQFISEEHLTVYYRGAHDHLLVAIREGEGCKF